MVVRNGATCGPTAPDVGAFASSASVILLEPSSRQPPTPCGEKSEETPVAFGPKATSRDSDRRLPLGQGTTVLGPRATPSDSNHPPEPEPELSTSVYLCQICRCGLGGERFPFSNCWYYCFTSSMGTPSITITAFGAS